MAQRPAALEMTFEAGNTCTVHGIAPEEAFRRSMKRAQTDVIVRVRYPAHDPSSCMWCTPLDTNDYRQEI